MNKIYNSQQVSVILNGITMTGFSKDIVKVEPSQKEKIKTEAGAQGDYVHSQNHDERHKVTLTVWQNSPSNIVLQNLLDNNQDFPLVITNNSDGAYLGQASSAVINERPSVSFGSEMKEVSWVITAADYKHAFL